MHPSFGKIVRLLVRIAIAVGFLWLMTSHVHWEQFKPLFSHTDLLWIVAAFFAFWLGFACRIARWTTMVRHANNRLRFLDCAGPFVAAFATNNVVPFRAGDFLRVFGFNRKLGTTSGALLATLVIERMMDLFTLLVLFAAALLFFRLDVSIVGVTGALLLLLAAILLVAMLRPKLMSPLVEWLSRLVGRFAPKVGARIANESGNAFTLLTDLGRQGSIAKLMAWSAAGWIGEGFVFWCAAEALVGIHVPVAAWLAFPAGTLATLIPSTPGYVGTFDFFTAQAMQRLGNDLTAATGYTFLVHALIWLPPTLVGWLYLLLHRRGEG